MAEANMVGDYYDRMTKGYLDTYGNTIQAFRPSRMEDLHEYVIASACLQDGMRILDAGCGVCGPSVYIAQKLDVSIDAITISPFQVERSQANVAAAGLTEQIRVQLCDFHACDASFEAGSKDAILFLETLGHATDPDRVLTAAASLLADEGFIYIKDFFPFDIEDEALRAKHQIVIENINKAYEYKVLNLHRTLARLRSLGLEIVFVKKMDFVDDIQARSDFESQFDVDLFGEMEEFRVAEWLEIKCRKPSYPLF